MIKFQTKFLEHNFQHHEQRVCIFFLFMLIQT